MAHEMGHYVMKDIYIGIAEYLLTTLIGLYKNVCGDYDIKMFKAAVKYFK